MATRALMSYFRQYATATHSDTSRANYWGDGVVRVGPLVDELHFDAPWALGRRSRTRTSRSTSTRPAARSTPGSRLRRDAVREAGHPDDVCGGRGVDGRRASPSASAGAVP